MNVSRLLYVASVFALCATAQAQPVVSENKKVTTAWDNAPFGVNQFNDPNIAELSATLPKGKKNSIVLVNATANAPTVSGSCEISYSVYLNDSAGGGYDTARNTGCAPGVGFCTVAGMFFFDLDLMDSSSPGSVIGQPLAIRMQINRRSGDACTFSTASFVAQLLKKK